MKNAKTYFIIIILIFILIMSLYQLFDTTDIIPVTDKEFVDAVEKKDCNLETYPEDLNNIGAESYLITDNDCPFTISYADIPTNKALNYYLNNTIKKIKNSKEGKSSSISLKDYYQYSLTSDRYQIVIQNGGTIIYADADINYKNDIDEILDELGYKFKINIKYFLITLSSFIALISIIIINIIKKVKILLIKGGKNEVR